jgi:WD40 repeat protein
VRPTTYEVPVVDPEPGSTRPRSLPEGHEYSVYAVAFSPDSKRLASCGGTSRAPGEVMLWDVATGNQVAEFQGHYGAVFCLALSPDGKLLASGGDDQTARLWDLATAKPLRTLAGHTQGVWAVAFSPDSTTLAAGDYDGIIRLWDVGSGTARAMLQPTRSEKLPPIRSLVFTPDGQTLISGTGAGTGGPSEVMLWDVATGKERSRFAVPGTLFAVALSPDGVTLASAGSTGKSGQLKLWDLATGKERATFRGHTSSVSSVAFSPDGQTLVSASYDHTVKVWEVPSGQLRSTRANDHMMRAIAFAPDGKLIASGSLDKTVRLWDATK